MKYLVATCSGCDSVWAMDYEPDPCVCLDPWNSDCSLDEIEADDFRHALSVVARRKP